ncbi:MAG: ATP-binding cassette domain-containing protein [Chloroflexota bacterium]
MTTHPSDDFAIDTEDLSRMFGDPSGGDGVVAVDQLTLEVRRGEVFGFLGHNGAGKTTTVRLLNGVLAPTGGRMRVLGYDPVEDGAVLRRYTGVLTETPSLDEKLSARENLTIYGRLYGVPEAAVEGRVRELLEEFGLDARATDLVGGYSRGMKQRLALARTLLHRPTLIFLDEPTAGLDPVATRRVHELVTRLSRRGGRTIFLCTHNLMEAQRLCHRVAVIEHGRLVAMGTPEDLARDLRHGVRLQVELEACDPDALPLLPDARDMRWDAEANVLSLWVPQREAIPDLVASLVAAGCRVYRVAPEEPTLEDVYFALHEGAAARAKREPEGATGKEPVP